MRALDKQETALVAGGFDSLGSGGSFGGYSSLGAFSNYGGWNDGSLMWKGPKPKPETPTPGKEKPPIPAQKPADTSGTTTTNQNTCNGSTKNIEVDIMGIFKFSASNCIAK